MLERIRQALIVLVLTATVLNIWTTLDAVSAVDRSYWVESYGTWGDALKPPDHPAVGNDGHALDRLIEWQDALAAYHVREVRVWERAAKVEFALLAGALCLWLLLPRVSLPRREH